MKSIKHKRLEKRVLTLLSDIYMKELNQSDRGFITFTECHLSGDNSHARIYVSIYEDELKQLAALSMLKQSIPLIRNRIAKNIRLYKIPKIEFKLDNSLGHIQKMNQLLES